MDIRLTSNSHLLTDLELCQVRLVDNSLFPWITLIPRRENLKEITDLDYTDRHLLLDEITFVMNIIKKVFSPNKINVAALGNIVSQLHIHVIARYTTDSAWPDPVFGKAEKPYSSEDLAITKLKLIQLLSNSTSQ